MRSVDIRLSANGVEDGYSREAFGLSTSSRPARSGTVRAGYVRSKLGRKRKAAYSHLCPVRVTPGGGARSSGTKKVGASGSPASTRYFSKSVMPSAARNVSSIRKLPVKLRDGF